MINIDIIVVFTAIDEHRSVVVISLLIIIIFFSIDFSIIDNIHMPVSLWDFITVLFMLDKFITIKTSKGTIKCFISTFSLYRAQKLFRKEVS